MMDSTSGGNILKPPNEDPTTYCRLCLSLESLRVLSSQADLIQVIWKQLEIQLVEPDDFPCAVCAVCVEKLEELFESNSDGQLEEWGDEGLLEFKESCRSVDEAIRSNRQTGTTVQEEIMSQDSMQGATPLVLPFQQLSDGRYRCNECPNVVFDAIETCIRHYQEDHPSVSGPGLIRNSGFQLFNPTYDCETCAAQFVNVDELIAHQKTHLAPPQPPKRNGDHLGKPPAKRIAKKTGKPSAVSNGSIHVNGDSGKKPYLKCVTCGETFAHVDELIEHRTTAHDVVLYKKSTPLSTFIVSKSSTVCKVCLVEFTSRKALFTHINMDHGQNLCYICERARPSGTLLKHQSSHRNLEDIVNPFLQGKHSYHCKVCFEKFRTEADIRLHFEMSHVDSDGATVVYGGGDGMATGTTDASLSPATEVLRITCTQCFISFGSSEEFEQHQLGCVDLHQYPQL